MDEWPFVGRDAELRRLRALVSERTGAVLAGPAGVGKTTLARACAAHAEADGMAVATAVATRVARAWPFGALAPLLPPDEEIAVADESRMLRRIGHAIVERAGGRDLLLVVDDAQHLDDASATLIHQLVQSRSVTLLVTLRSGVSAPDPVTSLWKDGMLERIDLGVLHTEVVQELLTTALGAPVRMHTARVLADACRGNPLFLRELVLGAVDGGDLVLEDGAWHLHAGLRPSSRLADLVDDRLGRLEPDEHELLELVALHEPLGSAELAALSTTETIESLERKAIITSRFDGRRLQVWLAHPIYGEATRNRIGAAHHRELVRRRADVIEATGARRRDDTILVAGWRLDTGGGSAEQLEAGARAARVRHDHELTWRMATAALEAGAGFEARLMAAEAAFLLGDRERVDQHLPALQQEAREESERARATALAHDVAAYLDGRPDLELLDGVEPHITDPVWRDELRSRRLNALWLIGGPAAVLADADAILAEHGPPFASFSYVIAAMSLACSGRIEDALRLCDRTTSEASASSTVVPWWRGTRWNVLTWVRWRAGRLDELARDLEPVLVDAVEADDVETQPFILSALARVHLAQGRLQSAVSEARDAGRLFRDIGRILLMRDPLVTAATAAAQRGDVAAAEDALAALDASGIPRMGDEWDRLHAEAWLAVAKDDLTDAGHRFHEAAKHGEAVADLTGAADSWHALVRIGDAKAARPHLVALAQRVEGSLMAARVAHAEAAVSGDAAALAGAAERFETESAWLLAAEAWCDAAVAYEHIGRGRDASAARQRAGRLAERCEGAATPALRTLDAAERLAEGELAAARLAAAGKSNREIADELNVSIRTVENRLQRAYEKLGVSGRGALRGALSSLESVS